jgi:hypothetical protein
MALERPLRESGLQSERVLWPDKGPGRFEIELSQLERKVG